MFAFLSFEAIVALCKLKCYSGVGAVESRKGIELEKWFLGGNLR